MAQRLRPSRKYEQVYLTLRLECPWNRLRSLHGGIVVLGRSGAPPTLADSRSGAVLPDHAPV